MQLKEIYRPIEAELADVEKTLKTRLKTAGHESIVKVGEYLLRAKGKRLRPALVILSAKASGGPKAARRQLSKIASGVELIHLASLIHDDVIDHAEFRHNKPTINAKWGDDVSISLGDYFYSVGFELISACRNTDMLACLSQAARLMCEGELVQVYERDNLDLARERYILIVKKKTASLFAASCQVGALASSSREEVKTALRKYGMNFGIAFQIVDDTLDLIGAAKALGKFPGADFDMGELTLPVLNLLSHRRDRDKIMRLVGQKHAKGAFDEIRKRFIDSPALLKTKEDASFYIRNAKQSLGRIEDSAFKQSLFTLADYVISRIDA